MWIPPEVRDPVLLHHPTRKSVGYFGAVRLRDGKFFAEQEAKQFNAQTTWRFLRHLRQRSSRSGRRVVVITDNAKYHHARMHKDWREAQGPQFQLLFLPPYSPDLNPIDEFGNLSAAFAFTTDTSQTSRLSHRQLMHNFSSGEMATKRCTSFVMHPDIRNYL